MRRTVLPNANASDSMAANESETNGLRGAAPDSGGQKIKG